MQCQIHDLGDLLVTGHSGPRRRSASVPPAAAGDASSPHMVFGRGTYFGGIDVGDAAAHERR
ncbi:MAG: hypothetical protein LC808_17335, partial [Actinobacteria bacterium]|nr:hypothetical protein [Actinomycetota bacterium]